MASLILQATYEDIQFALYKNEELLEQSSLVKTQASSLLMSELNKLLHKQALSWTDLAFIGVNQGPAPFTTLRALISTVNGISFSTGVPLVGVDGLTCFVNEYHKEGVTVVMLNAFAGDVYFATKKGQDMCTGWANGKAFVEELQNNFPEDTLTFVGNAVSLYQEEIEALLGEKATIPKPCPAFVSLNTIAENSFNIGNKKVPRLTPLYLKTQQYKPSC